MSDWVIARLDASHDRTAFRCGNDALDQFLTSLAGQYERRGLGVTYVATSPDNRIVTGYYTMASSAVDVSTLPLASRRTTSVADCAIFKPVTEVPFLVVAT